MRGIGVRLSVMMFLQFFVWGAWLPTLGACFSANGLSDAIAGVLGFGPLAAIVAPLFLGLVADRLLPSQVVLGVLMLIGAGFVYLAIGYAESADDPGSRAMVGWMFLGHLLCYMPTLGLGNTIAFTHVDDPNEFPAIRVWGTIGWIAAGLLVGAAGWSSSFNILWLAFGASLAAAAYGFTLPHTPPPAKGKPLDAPSLLMADAFGLLRDPPFAVFVLGSAAVCVPLAYYYAYTSNLLTTGGFEQAASTMPLGQASEVAFMLLIPLLFRRLGVKTMILIGVGAWVLRYVLFAFGASQQATWMLLAGVALHGVCYDFFFVTGFMYVDRKAPAELRGQAQSLLVFFTQGVGMWLGFLVAGRQYAATMTSEPALAKAIADGRGVETLSFFEKLTKMFSVSPLPEGIAPELVEATMAEWQRFWLLPAGMAAVILVLFAAAFWDRGAEEAADSAEQPA